MRYNSLFSSSIKQRKTFAVSHQGRGGGLTLDWNNGFSLTEGADPTIIWQYKFSQLRGSSDDGKSKLKLHFQDLESRSIETKVSMWMSANEMNKPFRLVWSLCLSLS